VGKKTGNLDMCDHIQANAESKQGNFYGTFLENVTQSHLTNYCFIAKPNILVKFLDKALLIPYFQV
jgi:hypothetical protein